MSIETEVLDQPAKSVPEMLPEQTEGSVTADDTAGNATEDQLPNDKEQKLARILAAFNSPDETGGRSGKHRTLMAIAAGFGIDQRRQLGAKVQSMMGDFEQSIADGESGQRSQRLNARLSEARSRLASQRAAHDKAKTEHFALLIGDDDDALEVARNAALETALQLDILQTEVDVITRLANEAATAVSTERRRRQDEVRLQLRYTSLLAVNDLVDLLWEMLSIPGIVESLEKLVLETGALAIGDSGPLLFQDNVNQFLMQGTIVSRHGV